MIHSTPYVPTVWCIEEGGVVNKVQGHHDLLCVQALLCFSLLCANVGSLYLWQQIFKCRPLFNANSYPQSDSISYRRVNDISIHLCWCCFIGVDWFQLFLPSQNTWIAFSHHGRWPILTSCMIFISHKIQLPWLPGSDLKFSGGAHHYKIMHQLVLRLSWAVTI